MRRSSVGVGIVAGAAALVAAVPSPASAATMATCSAQTPVLQFSVDRNATGRDRSRRAISLRYGGGTSAAAIKPIRLTVVRGGRTRTLQWSSLNSEYRYRARKGEKAGFMALYTEDSSGYGQSSVAGASLLPVDISGVIGALAPALQSVFGLLPPQLGVLSPVASLPGRYASEVCARVQPLVVQEQAPSSSRSRK